MAEDRSHVVLVKLQEVPGFVAGLTQPGVLVWLQVADDPTGGSAWSGLEARLAPYLPSQDAIGGDKCLYIEPQACLPVHVTAALIHVARCLAWLQEAAGLPVLDHARLMPGSVSSGVPEGFRCVLVFPSMAPRAAALALDWLMRVAFDGPCGDHSPSLPTARQRELETLLGAMAQLAPGGKNNRHFLQAARQMGIPFLRLPMGVIQYGWGRRSRRMDSSVTDATSNIAARLARSKLATAAMLRQAGLPVPLHEAVPDIDTALELAQRWTYPLVVKPADMDGGVGVSPGLANDDELRSAFDRARRYSSRILLEQHVPGRDYRMYVFNGRLVWAVERVQAGVTGDGVSTVGELIDTINRDPFRGTQAWSPLVPLSVNGEAQELLDGLGLTLQSVPGAGQFVPLRRAANVSSGGTPYGVMDKVHPENARLAERAAAALRLDMAGVDVLTPDIGTSWLESGGWICEVNAQPQMSNTSPHIHAQILGELLSGDGRIPVIVMVVASPSEAALDRIAEILAQQGMCLGYATPKGLVVGGHTVRRGPGSSFLDVRALLMDPSVDAVAVAIQGHEWLSTGAPVDRFDLLILLQETDAAQSDGGPASGTEDDARMLRLLAEQCSGAVWVSPVHRMDSMISGIFSKEQVFRGASAQDVPVELARWLLAETLRRKPPD